MLFSFIGHILLKLNMKYSGLYGETVMLQSMDGFWQLRSLMTTYFLTG